MLAINECLNKIRAKQCETTTLLSSKTMIVNITKLLEDRTMEDYVVFGVLCSITHHSKGEDDNNTYKYGRPAKRSKNYNRIFFFGGLDGSTFVYICETERSSSTICSLMIDEIGIGTPFLIYEPITQKFDTTLKTNQFEIKSNHPLIPLDLTIYDSITDIKPRNPTLVGEQLFFLMKAQKIRLYRCILIGVKNDKPPSCQGQLCDRKNIMAKTNQPCGCFTKHSSVSPVVLEFNVEWDECKEKTLQCEIQERSYRTTKLFIRYADQLGSSQRSRTYSNKVTPWGHYSVSKGQYGQ